MKNIKKFNVLFFVFIITIVGFIGVKKVEAVDAGPCPGTPTVAYGGKTYNTVHVGTQCWFKENLNIGTKITNTVNTLVNQTNNNIIEKYCYGNQDSGCDSYGGIYQWGELIQYKNGASNSDNWNPVPTGNIQGVCPVGWHVPRISEILILKNYLNGDVQKLKEAGSLHWGDENKGTNSSGFTAFKDSIFHPVYGYVKNAFYMWAADLNNAGFPVYFALVSSGDVNNFSGAGIYRSYGFPVRCLKDEAFSVVPSVSVAVVPTKFTVEEGASVTYTAIPENGGTNPTYQWKKNGVNISGANSSTYTYIPSSSDTITVVIVSNKTGMQGVSAVSAPVKITTTTPILVPGVPTNLNIPFGSDFSYYLSNFSPHTAVNLSWNKPVNNGGSIITSYKIEYKPSFDSFAQWTSISYVGTTSNNQSKSISGINVDNGYDFRVSAVNNKGVGNYAELLSPNKITGITAVPGDKQITLNWDTLINRGSPISTINIYYKQTSSPNNSTWLSASVPATSSTKTITGLVNGTSYDFKIIPSSLVPGPMPDKISSTPSGAVASPVSVLITSSPAANSDGKIPLSAGLTTVTFTATPTNGGTNPTYQWKKNGVNIFGATGATYTTWAQELPQIKVVMTSSLSNTTGNPATSNTITITANTPTSPEAPTALTGTFGGGTTNLSWQAPSNNGGSPITGYNVEYKLKTESAWSSTTSTTTSKAITGLLGGQSYDFRVSAVNAIGTGPFVSITAPSKPLNLIATPSNGKVVLNWTTPTTDGGSPISYYLMRYKETSKTAATDWVPAVSISAPNTTYTVNNLINGTSYDFKVRAVSASAGEWSDAATTSPLATLSTNNLVANVMEGVDSLKQTSSFTTEKMYKFTTNLSYGKKNNDVKQLQSFLKSKGYLSIQTETNYFGKATKQALIKFQQDNDISPASGNLGPKTIEFINSME